MYSYLTGSASWFILTLLTQAFGIRGEYGDLLIAPKLTDSQFRNSRDISITCSFAGKIIEVKFINPHKKDFGRYSITKVCLNGKVLTRDVKQNSYIIPRRKFLSLANKTRNTIEVILD
jgi:cellobiose phosphorylase